MAAVATLRANLKVLPEPELEFRHGQRTLDPHAGLALFGPYSGGTGSHPRSIVYGLIGASEGVDAFQNWSRLMQTAIVEPLEPKRKMGRMIPPDDRKQYLLWPPFPGFEGAFSSEWPVPGGWRHELDRSALLKFACQKDPNSRAYDVVGTYCDALSRMKKRPRRGNLWVI